MKNLLVCFIILTLIRSVNAANAPIPNYENAKRMTDAHYQEGIVRHFVAFKFLPHISPKIIQEVNRRFIALIDLCKRNGKAYILSIESGMANSTEGADQGMQIGFIVSFKSQGDRNYYVGQPMINENFVSLFDPAHANFKKYIAALLATPVVPQGVFVFDFTAGP